MSFGPELLWGWSRFLQGYTGIKVQKTDAADSWAVFSFSGDRRLLLSWGADTCGAAVISEIDRKTLLAAAKQTPPIAAALKKHLAGAQLTAVEQQHRDRLLRLTFRRAVSADHCSIRHLRLEAMDSYSNLILTDEQDVILETAKHVHPDENRFRSILPGLPYTPPPEFKGIELEQWLCSPSADTLMQLRGFGRPLLQELSSMKIEHAVRYLSNFYGNINMGGFHTAHIRNYITVSPEPTGGQQALDEAVVEAGRATTLVPLLERNSSARLKKIEKYLRREITRREKQRQELQELLRLNPVAVREEAELLVANLWRIKQGDADVELQHWSDTGQLIITPVKLNGLISPQKNAALLFARYKKLAASQKRAEPLLKKVVFELEALREQLAMALLADDGVALGMIEYELGILPQTKKEAKKKCSEEAAFPPHKRYDLGFALVFTGLSANGNRYVTFNLASPQDIWFHAQGAPGSHVVLRFTRQPDENEVSQALEFCASLAVWSSRARENEKAWVDYTERKHVNPIKGYVANVTYHDFKSIRADPRFWKAYLADTGSAQQAEGS